MNKFLNTILRSSIAASLSDREALTERLAKVIEDKIGSDPETAKEFGDKIATAMESIDEQLLIDQILNPQPDNNTKELAEKLDRLTLAIDRLNANLEKLPK